MPDLKRYDQLRNAQKHANSILLDAIPNGAEGRSIINAAAKALSYPIRNGAIVFPHEPAVDRLYEFMLYEPRLDGTVWAQHVLESENNFSALEREVVQAVLVARTSLFEVTRVVREESTIVLHDLLVESPELSVVDRGLSSTTRINSLTFGRPVRMGELNFLSGSSVAFSANEKSLLLARAAKLNRVKNPSLLRRKRFGLFVELEKYSSVSVLYG